MDIEQARANMIECQLRPWEVQDAETLEALLVVAREEFVPPAWRNLAYADFEVPLGHDAVMLTPKVEARALQALSPRRRETALEIGTGSGNFAALLATCAEHVCTVEIAPELADAARSNLRREDVYRTTGLFETQTRPLRNAAPLKRALV